MSVPFVDESPGGAAGLPLGRDCGPNGQSDLSQVEPVAAQREVVNLTVSA
jgi:hypothetical protein